MFVYKVRACIPLLMLLFLAMIIGCSKNPPGSIYPVSLTCEYGENPLGIETQHPNLSWKLESGKRNQVQKAYQVIVANSIESLSENEGDIWNSGKVDSDQSVHVPYAGTKRLESGRRYFWKVRVWDQEDMASEWSEPAYWEMGLLDPADWKASWIGYTCDGAPLFRKEFFVNKKIRKANIYICGLGYYELRLNGEKVGDNVLDPGQTDYEMRSYYVAYEVTKRVKPGWNAIGVELGNGFYHQTSVGGAFGWEDVVYGKPRLIAQLHIRFEDESETVILTDQHWKTTEGPTKFNNVYVGDYYDARTAQPAWDESGFDDAAWCNARIMSGPGGKLVSQKLPPIKRMEIIHPIRIFNPKPGMFVYDMGQNFAGWARLKVSAKEETEIRLRYSEEISDDKTINMASCGGYATGVEQTGRYICKGGSVTEVWEPKFSYHGFRYVEMTGFPGTPNLENLEGILVHTSASQAGEFSCSDTMINRIHQAALWTVKSNIHSVITDCPHREKCGWLGDVIAEMLIYNLDVPLLLKKFERDIETSRTGVKPVLVHDALPGNVKDANIPDGIPWDIAPGRRTGGHRPDWGSTFIHLPWYIFLYYGDISLAREHWEGMTFFMNHLQQLSRDHIIYQGYGDMFSPGHIWSVETPVALTSTAIYYHNARIMSVMADRLGKSRDASKYEELASRIEVAFNTRFYDPVSGSYGSQTANAMALEFGLVPDGDVSRIAKSIAEDIMDRHQGHLNTGHMGSRYLYGALADHGYDGLARIVLNQKTYPGIGHLFSKGATTFWESWGEKEIDENSAGVRSRNHPFQAGYDAWFFSGIGGIRPDPEAPGFKQIVLKPELTGELDFARTSYESVYGTIISDWKFVEDDFNWTIQIPVNTSAMVYFPAQDPGTITESGEQITGLEGIEYVGKQDDRVVLKIGSGTYEFTITPQETQPFFSVRYRTL